MPVLPDGVQRATNCEIVQALHRTLRQQLHAFFGVGEEGSQLVEMAVVAPLLIIILTGLASFGMALYTQQQLGLSAANAVQAVATGADYITSPNTPCTLVEAAVTAGLPSWNPANISYTLTITMVVSGTSSTHVESWSGTNYPTDCATTGLNDLEGTSAQFQPLVLAVSYPYSWFPIFTWSRYGSTFKPSGNLQTTQAAMIQ